MATIRKLRGDNLPTAVEASGKRGVTYFRFQQIPLAASYTHFEDKPKFEEVDALADKYIEMYTSEAVDRVVVVYQRFVSVSKQFSGGGNAVAAVEHDD